MHMFLALSGNLVGSSVITDYIEVNANIISNS